MCRYYGEGPYLEWCKLSELVLDAFEVDHLQRRLALTSLISFSGELAKTLACVVGETADQQVSSSINLRASSRKHVRVKCE
jgi:hypothetical protein